MTTSAITVVIFQFWVSRIIKHRPPFLMMAFGTVFYMIGFCPLRHRHHLCLVRPQHCHHHHRRDDRCPDQPGAGCQLCPRRYARPLHGGLRTFLGDPFRRSVPARPATSWITTTRTCSGTSAEPYADSPSSPTTSSSAPRRRSSSLLPLKREPLPAGATTD